MLNNDWPIQKNLIHQYGAVYATVKYLTHEFTDLYKGKTYSKSLVLCVYLQYIKIFCRVCENIDNVFEVNMHNLFVVRV